MTAILRKVFAKSHLRIYLIRTFNKSQSVTNSCIKHRLDACPWTEMNDTYRQWHSLITNNLPPCYVSIVKNILQSVKWLWISQKDAYTLTKWIMDTCNIWAKIGMARFHQTGHNKIFVELYSSWLNERKNLVSHADYLWNFENTKYCLFF